ncbi:hypothetical protein [Nocardia wallacei]|uniref:hypothetical protein n=1 Tax=Nocardia wallacei TaxID=480035 RepID=UPI002456C509|nr:hypothetical protein [Nocardia wallacei]
MADEFDRLQRQALESWRHAMRAYQKLVDTPPANRLARRMAAPRFGRAASAGESVLFRLICTDLDAPAPRCAYGEIAMRRSVVAAGVTGRMMSEVAVNAARAVLWAWDRPELTTLDPVRIMALADQDPVRSPFALADGTVTVFTGARRVTLAAQARLFLAERLISTQLRIKSDSMTTRHLDATLAARDKFYSSDEWLVWHCRLESCRAMAALPEAMTLATEALRIYEILAGLGTEVSGEELDRTRARYDAVVSRIPLDLR